MRDFFKSYVYPVAVISGSIIGVGFLALPYIALQVGIWAMLFYFIALSLLMIFIHVIFAEISLKTPDFKRFPGFVGHYLGNSAKNFTLAITIFGLFGVLLAYLIVGGEFLTAVFSPVFGGSATWYTAAYFLAASLVVCFGVKAVAKVELGVLLLFLAILITVFLKSFSFINVQNIFLNSLPLAKDWKTMFLPYGALLFALWGSGLIPEAEEMLAGKKHLLKIVVIIATLVPAIIYFLFTLMVLGVTGAGTTDSALVGFKDFFGNGISSLAIFIGVATTFMAFVANGLLVKKIFMYDMGFKNASAWALACFAPLVLFLAGINSFIPLISFIGGVFLGINGIFILLIYKKIGGKNFIIYPLSLIFLLGIVYEIVYFIK